MARTPSTAVSGGADVFPALHCCSQLASGERLYDVKFYPFPTADNEQVFAVAGVKDIFVCRLDPQDNPPYKIIRWFKDTDLTSEWNSIAWTRSPTTGNPLICVAGAKPKCVQIFDVAEDRHIRSLVGHGRGINDLVVSPLAETLLFSAGEDYTVRIWSLDPTYEKQPCVGIFAGEGHRQPILTIDIHPNGRWMLSGGLDTAICLWAIPSPLELSRDTSVDTKEHYPDPKLIYYPYFHSTEIHHNFVDSVKFHGDLIVSKAAKDPGAPDHKLNAILIWKICDFVPDDDPPGEPPIPEAGVYTRSAFSTHKKSRGFQRLLTLDMPNTDRFYQRFGLLHLPGMRSILAMGNQESKMLFWDLQKFEEGLDPGEDMKRSRSTKGGKKSKGSKGSKPNIGNDLNRLEGLRREQSAISDSASTPGTATGNVPVETSERQDTGSEGGARRAEHVGAHASSTSLSTPQERKYELSDPFQPIPAHMTKSLPTKLSRSSHFGTSAVAFSPDGAWMIGVGDNGMMNIFQRDTGSAKLQT